MVLVVVDPLLWFSRTKGTHPLPCLNLINLITYLFSFLLFGSSSVLLALGLPVPAYPSHHHLPRTGVGVGLSIINTHVIISVLQHFLALAQRTACTTTTKL